MTDQEKIANLRAAVAMTIDSLSMLLGSRVFTQLAGGKQNGLYQGIAQLHDGLATALRETMDDGQERPRSAVDWTKVDWSQCRPLDGRSAEKLMAIVHEISNQHPDHVYHFVRSVDGDGPWSVACSCGETYVVQKRRTNKAAK